MVANHFKCLKRVMQDIWLMKQPNGVVSLKVVRMAMIKNIATTEPAIKRNIDLLVKIKWLKRINRWQFRIGNEYISEDVLY